MKLYQELIIKKGQQELVFGGLILNDNSELEFTVVKTPKGVFGTSCVVNEKTMKIKYDRLWLSIGTEDMKRLSDWKGAMVKSITTLYKDILAGKEEIIAYPVKDEEVKYILTTERILEAGMFSPKYNKAMLYAFSPAGLQSIKVKMDLGFDGYDDFLMKMSPILEKMKLKNLTATGTDGHVQEYHKFKLMDAIKNVPLNKAS